MQVPSSDGALSVRIEYQNEGYLRMGSNHIDTQNVVIQILPLAKPTGIGWPSIGVTKTCCNQPTGPAQTQANLVRNALVLCESSTEHGKFWMSKPIEVMHVPLAPPCKQ